MSAHNPRRDPALARPPLSGIGQHELENGIWFEVEWRSSSDQGAGWYWFAEDDESRHGPFNTDHAAYDDAVEAFA